MVRCWPTSTPRRYFCNACHVSQTDAQPLVRNTFRDALDAVACVRCSAGSAVLWTVVRSPATSLSLGFLTLGGFACGLVFWGAFNTALEFTNTETFCLSCHEMRSNVYQELSRTVHFSNRSGVRAICSDCHVPHNWTDKIARKMQASKEVWGHLFGTIDTRQKFLDHRLELAEHEWARLKANDSLECRNCHTAPAMDLTKQTERAARIHQRYLLSGERTCIDCHKGIAHELAGYGGRAARLGDAAGPDRHPSAGPLKRGAPPIRAPGWTCVPGSAQSAAQGTPRSGRCRTNWSSTRAAITSRQSR